jgi:hypothetical protein
VARTLKRTLKTIALLPILLIPFWGAGCGMVYRAHTEVRASNMVKTLQPGQTTLDVHAAWGEPDIRVYPDQHTQIWSYAKKANTNDVTAAFLYTASKEGDSGRFLDLKFTDNKLASWSEADHTMPQKDPGGYGFGMTGGSQSTFGGTRY